MVITHKMLILMGNVDVESVVEYATKTPGVALDTGNAELTGMDPDFDVEPTGVEMDSEAQGYVPEEHNKAETTAKCPVAQHKLHHPRRE